MSWPADAARYLGGESTLQGRVSRAKSLLPSTAFASSMHTVFMERALLLHPLHPRAPEVSVVCVGKPALNAAQCSQEFAGEAKGPTR